jgi:hypothetical protein
MKPLSLPPVNLKIVSIARDTDAVLTEQRGTESRHWTLSWVSWIQFTSSCPLSLWLILMSSHLHTQVFQAVFSWNFCSLQFFNKRSRESSVM